MINNSRLSNGVRAAGLMRRAVTEALFVAHRRVAFGRRLVELPLMRRQLLKMLVRAEQARSMMLQTAEALRRSDAGEPGAYALLRILTPLIKFRACRDARVVAGDAMEVRGGCGYIEEWPDPRILRDAHLGSIWEGTSNIVALDVRRAARRENALAALRAHVTALLDEAPPLADARSRAGPRLRADGRGAGRWRRSADAAGGVGAVPRGLGGGDGVGGWTFAGPASAGAGAHGAGASRAAARSVAGGRGPDAAWTRCCTIRREKTSPACGGEACPGHLTRGRREAPLAGDPGQDTLVLLTAARSIEHRA